jgi:lipoprotein
LEKGKLWYNTSLALLSALGCVKHGIIAFGFEQKRSEYLTNIIPDLNLFISFRTIFVSC